MQQGALHEQSYAVLTPRCETQFWSVPMEAQNSLISTIRCKRNQLFDLPGLRTLVNISYRLPEDLLQRRPSPNESLSPFQLQKKACLTYLGY